MSNHSLYIGQIVASFSFQRDERIRYQVEKIEKSFSGIVNVPASSTNVPDEMPSIIPRFNLQSSQKLISVSQVGVQLTMSFSENRKTIAETIAIAKKNISDFWRGFVDLKSQEERAELGVVCAFYVPTTNKMSAIANQIASRYLKFPNLGTVAIAGAQIGYSDPNGRYYKNISIAPYEMRQGQFAVPQAPKNILNVSEMSIKEFGIEIKIDYNNKPMVEAGIPITNEVGVEFVNQLENFSLSESVSFYSDWE